MHEDAEPSDRDMREVEMYLQLHHLFYLLHKEADAN